MTPSIARPLVTAPRTSFEPIHSVAKVGASETACWSWVPLPRRMASWNAPVVVETTSTDVAPGTAMLSYGRSRAKFAGSPVPVALGAITSGESDTRASSAGPAGLA